MHSSPIGGLGSRGRSERDRAADAAIDSAANYLLGLPLLLAPDRTPDVLGLPCAGNRFYARVLGGVLAGIATALAMGRGRGANSPVGLGTGGAIVINTLGSGAVAAWLATRSDADALPKRGRVMLWRISVGVFSIGAAEAWTAAKRRARDSNSLASAQRNLGAAAPTSEEGRKWT